MGHTIDLVSRVLNEETVQISTMYSQAQSCTIEYKNATPSSNSSCRAPWIDLITRVAGVHHELSAGAYLASLWRPG